MEAYESLRKLRRQVETLTERHIKTLSLFHLGGPLRDHEDVAPVHGFSAFPWNGGVDRVSLASTASCVRSLLGSGRLVGSRLDFAELKRRIEERFKAKQLSSRGLKHMNPFTLSLALPLLHWLGFAPTETIVEACLKRGRSLLARGGVRFSARFPPDGYLSYWILRGVEAFGDNKDAWENTLMWADTQFHRQLALFSCGNDDESDAYQLGYSLLILRRFSPQRLRGGLQEYALRSLFEAQLARGLWEKKKPIFVRGKDGDAYCFAFELLTALIEEFGKEPSLLLPFFDNFRVSFDWISRNTVQVGEQRGWRSGNVTVANTEPESWATAEIFFFLEQFQGLLSRQIEEIVLEKFDGRSRKSPKELASFDWLAQAEVKLGKSSFRILDLMHARVVVPLVTDEGYSLSRNRNKKKCSRSGILYGPPGTGKTTIVRCIADLLGWSLVVLDPSDFAASGFSLVASRTTEVFSYLMELDDTVILFDEMEELTRERQPIEEEVTTSSFEQKFLTTSFLPKLQALHDRARSVFFLATNFFGHIDSAARRLGRFDFHLPLLAPTPAEKIRVLEARIANGDLRLETEVLKELKYRLNRATVEDELWWLTWPETWNLFGDLQAAKSRGDVEGEIAAGRPIAEKEHWKKYLEEAQVARFQR